MLLSKGAINSADWAAFLRLQSNLDDFQTSGGQVFENLCLMAKAVEHYSGTGIPASDIVGLLARLMINSFTLVTAAFDPIGIVLDPILARMNHSCDPNAYVRCDLQGAVQVIALKDIAHDEEVLISYVDSTYPTRIRQRELKERYFFDCRCNKCTDPHDMDFPITEMSEARFNQILATEAEVTEVLKAATDDPDALASSVPKLEHALHLLCNFRNWPLHRQPFPQVRHAYIVLLITVGQYNAAFTQAMIQKLAVDEVIMPNEFHPIRMVHDWVLICLVDQIMQGGDGTAQRINLQDHGIQNDDLGAIRIALLQELWGRVERLPENTFRKMVEVAYKQLTDEGRTRRNPAKLEEQWAKVKKLINVELQREKKQAE